MDLDIYRVPDFMNTGFSTLAYIKNQKTFFCIYLGTVATQNPSFLIICLEDFMIHQGYFKRNQFFGVKNKNFQTFTEHLLMPKNSLVGYLQKKIPESILETFMDMIGDHHFQENFSMVRSIHQTVTTNQIETLRVTRDLSLQTTGRKNSFGGKQDNQAFHRHVFPQSR